MSKAELFIFIHCTYILLSPPNLVFSILTSTQPVVAQAKMLEFSLIPLLYLFLHSIYEQLCGPTCKIYPNCSTSFHLYLNTLVQDTLFSYLRLLHGVLTGLCFYSYSSLTHLPYSSQSDLLKYPNQIITVPCLNSPGIFFSA